MADTPDMFPGYENVEEYSKDAIKSILLCTKAANQLPPSGEKFEYYKTFRGFRLLMKNAQKSLLSTLTGLIPSNSMRDRYEKVDDLEEQFDMIQDLNATIFEHMDDQINEASGAKQTNENLHFVTKTSVPIKTSWNRQNARFNTKRKSFTLMSSKNIVRPQLSFKEKVDNSSSPFVPLIKEKPNAIKPLALILEKDGDREEFCHPYEWEIEKFKPLEEHLQPSTPMIPKSVDDTPLVMVKDVQTLHELCEELKKVGEFAVDIEHHSYRSFQGIACLMQISTREKDYIIDALELRSELWILNEVFTDPKIIKVLHGADMDVFWLQRDFGLYIVNLFDTGQAARVLNFAHLSLLYLIRYYCKFDLDKQFQLADWRVRPLPEEMVKYAREDTHNLLYVYDCLKNDLLTKGNEHKNLLLSVFHRSKEICLKKYKKMNFSEDYYLEFYKRSRKNFNVHQLFCLKELYRWRDGIARVEDESYAYVLPNHMLLQIAEILPREQQGVLACCNPIPPLVRQQLNEIHSIVMKASLATIAQLQEKVDIQASQLNSTVDLHNMLDCPHDIRLYQDHTGDSSDFSGHSARSIVYDLQSVKVPFLEESTLPVGRFECQEGRNPISKEVIASIQKSNRTPYERYLLTRQHYGTREQNLQSDKASKDFIENVSNFSEATVSSSLPTTSKGIIPIPSGRKRTSGEMEDPSVSVIKEKKQKNKDSRPSSSLTEPPQSLDSSVEIVDEVPFHPFDYDQAGISILKETSDVKNGKQGNERFQLSESTSNFKAQNKRRRGGGKQSTFNFSSKGFGDRNKNWPK